jgi:hypothetical protein
MFLASSKVETLYEILYMKWNFVRPWFVRGGGRLFFVPMYCCAVLQ